MTDGRQVDDVLGSNSVAMLHDFLRQFVLIDQSENHSMNSGIHEGIARAELCPTTTEDSGSEAPEYAERVKRGIRKRRPT